MGATFKIRRCFLLISESLQSLNARSNEVKMTTTSLTFFKFLLQAGTASESIHGYMANLDRSQMHIGLPQEPPKIGLLECGVDEVGIGSAIAEVYAAACILDPTHRINGLRDSKQLTPERRKQLSDRITERALDFCIATASLEEVNQLNVFGATMLAMQRAVAGLKLKPDVILIDGNRMPKLPFPARTIVKGDAKIRCISAASILAKVARDEAMLKYHEQFPNYGFADNKGYLTEFHLATLKEFGPCPVHRRNYAPVRALLEGVEPSAVTLELLLSDELPPISPAADRRSLS
jgi:ribonuclease HII